VGVQRADLLQSLRTPVLDCLHLLLHVRVHNRQLRRWHLWQLQQLLLQLQLQLSRGGVIFLHNLNARRCLMGTQNFPCCLQLWVEVGDAMRRLGARRLAFSLHVVVLRVRR